MGEYAVYAIDDSVGPDTAADEVDLDAEPDADGDDADYVPQTLPVPKQRRRVGTVSLDASGKLALLSAEPGEDADILAAVDHMNGRPTLFLKALQDNLQRWHGMELEAEAA